MKQAADVLRMEKETAEKLAAKAFAKSYLSDLVPSVFNNLRENGYFYDPVHRDLETGFMPWIMDHTMFELDQLAIGRFALDSLIKQIVRKRENDYKNLEQTMRERSGSVSEGRPTVMATMEVNNQNGNNDASSALNDDTSNQDDVE